MRIYADTSVLIDVVERDPKAGEELRARFVNEHHNLVLSFLSICELMGPLWNGAQAVVTRTMNRLEEWPHEWINLATIHNSEVRSALASVRAGTPYAAIDPYVQRFTDTLVGPAGPVDLILNYPLAEAVFDLWRSGQFNYRRQQDTHIAAYRRIMEEERELLQQVGDVRRARRELLETKHNQAN